MSKISKNKIFIELVNNQIDTKYKKLDVKSLQRISRNIDKSIFKDECVIWNGYITYIKDTDVHYINFFYNKKKHALHRLLYLNFVGHIEDSEYIKYKCNNKGKCCNINHFYKIKSRKKRNLENNNLENNNLENNNLENNNLENDNLENNNLEKKNIENNSLIQTVKQKEKLIIIF